MNYEDKKRKQLIDAKTYANHGSRWLLQDESLVQQAAINNERIEAIADRLGRRPTSIAMRLYKNRFKAGQFRGAIELYLQKLPNFIFSWDNQQSFELGRKKYID